MKRAIRVPALGCLPAALLFATYLYYSEDLSNPTFSNWSVTGTMQVYNWSGGYSGIGHGSNGTMLYPSSTSGGEVKLTIRLDPTNPGGTYTVYSCAASDLSSYYSIILSNVGIYAGHTQGVLYVEKINSGSYTILGMTTVQAYDGMNFRVDIEPKYSSGSYSTTIFTYTDATLVSTVVDTSSPLTAGWNGFGVAGTDYYDSGSGLFVATGNMATYVTLGNMTTTPPSGIYGFTASPAPTYVNLSWSATSDPGGPGVWAYQVYRNSTLLTTTSSLSYTDSVGLVPGTTYNYTLAALDFFQNSISYTQSFTTAHTPTNPPFPSATPDGRRVGVRSTGAYWGASNENLDVFSGNINFALPLLNPQGRGGWSVPFKLVYNSQNWGYNTSTAYTSLFDKDVGYGFGWRLLAGAIIPVWNTGGMTAAYYLFIDSTGAEYRLDQNSGSTWYSKDSIFVYFDTNFNSLHFRDGSVWYMGCISAPGEADQGVMYPTFMDDVNGNTIVINYQTSPLATWSNSSARITTINDVRSSGTYTFTYNSDPIPHLTSITNNIGTGEKFTFAYGSQTVGPPFGSTYSPFTSATLTSASVTTLGMTHSFSYNSNGELTQVNLPYGGYLKYDYTTTTYATNLSYREVAHRYLSKDGTTGSQVAYPLAHESSPSSYNTHQFATIDDPSGNGEKYWAFGASGISWGLVTQYQGRQLPGPLTQTQNDFTWAQDGVGNSYIQTSLTTLDPGQSYQAQKQSVQSVDNYGNVTQVQNYDFGNLTTPAKTYNYTYLNSSAYTNGYILNRMASSSVTIGGTTTPLTTITYDLYGTSSGGHSYPALASVASGLWQWGNPGSTTRGLPVQVVSPSGTTYIAYDLSGNVVSTTVNGIQTSVSTSSSTNYAAPSQITVGSLSTNMNWSSFLGPTSQSGPNGDTASASYDGYARPTGSTSPFGATTSITYNSPPFSSSSPATITSTTNGRWSRQTLDGLGHTILSETGDSTGTKSQAESVYAPCACSPALKLQKTAMPHAVGATPVWTQYTYDGIGRTVSVLAPDGSSTTTYQYQGNTVKTTDPAGKWKKFTMDAFGNLTTVVEPDPANPTSSTYTTSYTYDAWGNLAGVSMPRGSTTQTRTFTYSGSLLQSATNPENGTVSYYYNSMNKVSRKHDAKGQDVVYTYDSIGRLIETQKYPSGIANAEDVCQQENYSYDSNPYVSGYSSYASGRLAAVQYYGGSNAYSNAYSPGTNCDTTFQEMYNYTQAGGKAGKWLRVSRMLPSGSGSGGGSPSQWIQTNADLTSTYTFDNEGRITAMQYPSYGPTSSPTAGPDLGYAMDSMGRLNTMTDLGASSTIISGATYGPSNELLSMSGSYSESRTYNPMLQLTQLSNGSVNITYNYSSTQNNGKITSQTDNISGETVVYTYDSLNRLASAGATSSSWGQSYGYDGFGNLTTQTVTAGSAPAYSVTPDPTTNHLGSTDANGNSTDALTGGYPAYDVMNRLIAVGSPYAQYSYAPGNKRVWRGIWTSGSLTTDEVTFWGISGQKLATYSLTVGTTTGPCYPATYLTCFYGTMTATQATTNYYFGGKLIKNGAGYVGSDRLGSIGKYYPYGQEKPSATTNGTEKFTGYFRDAETGLDYADQRYHNPGTARFLTPDPLDSSASSNSPGSWNRYAYVSGDPTNLADRDGLDTCDGQKTQSECEEESEENTDFDWDPQETGGGPLNLGDYTSVEVSDTYDPVDLQSADIGGLPFFANGFAQGPRGGAGGGGGGNGAGKTPCLRDITVPEGQRLIDNAQKHLGTPYKTQKTPNGMVCTDLVCTSIRSSLLPTFPSSASATGFGHLPNLRPIGSATHQPGDVIVFPGHVGLLDPRQGATAVLSAQGTPTRSTPGVKWGQISWFGSPYNVYRLQVPCN